MPSAVICFMILAGVVKVSSRPNDADESVSDTLFPLLCVAEIVTFSYTFKVRGFTTIVTSFNVVW